MPKRNRSNEQRKTGHVSPVRATTAPTVGPTAAETEQARAARLFNDSIRQHDAADQAERDRKAATVERERLHQQLIAGKAAAAAAIRVLRENGRPHAKMLEAEAAYRVALADLTEFETGERPHWAPAPPPAEPESDGAGDVSVEPAADSQSSDSQLSDSQTPDSQTTDDQAV